MARLPSAYDLGERPTPQPSASVASYRPARDNLGAQISSAGGELVQASAIVEETNRRQDMIAAEAALNRLQEQRIALEHDQKAGFRNVREGNAVGQQFVDGYMSRFDDAANLIADGLHNEQQRAMFKQRMPVVGLHYRSSLLEHQARQTEAFNTSTEKSALDLELQSAAMRPTNDLVLQTSMMRINSTIDQMATRQGLAPERVAVLKSTYQDAAYAARVSSVLVGVPGVVDSNPYQALDMIEKTREKMKPETVLELTGRANTAIRMLENAQRIEQDKRLKEAEAAIRELGEFSLNGSLPDDGYQAVVRSKVQGTPFQEQAESLIKQSMVGAMHGSKSIPLQQEAIRVAEATLAKGSSPEAEKVLGMARRITETQVAAYKENPWAAGTKFQRLPPVPDKPLSSAESVPQYVAEILPMMNAVEAAAGPQVQVSPLQPAQAQAFVQQLQAMPPGPRSEVLGATGERLTVQRIHALAEQIDKGNRPLSLALKLGADRTNAGRMVSELVLRGSDAIKDKAIKRDDAALTGWRSEISAMVRGTMGDQQAEQDAIDAAYFVRAAMDVDGVAAPGFNLTASNENAVKLVIGQPVERAGVKTVLPKGMDEGTFNAKLRAYTPDRLALEAPGHVVFVRGHPKRLDQFAYALPEMGFKRDGQGRYIPVSGGALVTLDPEGQTPLRLDVR